MGTKKPTEPRFYGEVTEKSHKTMSHIRGKDTAIETKLRKALWKKGYRYRKNYKNLPGRPDIVLTKYRIAIFCDSEFFHGKDWEVLRPRLEKGRNPDYWVKKIQRNMERDIEKIKHYCIWDGRLFIFGGKDILEKPEECVQVIEEVIFDQQMEKIDFDEEI